jgi:peptidoglycan/LPS O-acetylase OafA/YrhL
MFAGMYLVMYVALSWGAIPRAFADRADLSYGVYLYGWPIQQALLYWSDQSLQPLTLAVLALLATLPAAYLSWRFVERPALALVRK